MRQFLEVKEKFFYDASLKDVAKDVAGKLAEVDLQMTFSTVSHRFVHRRISVLMISQWEFKIPLHSLFSSSLFLSLSSFPHPPFPSRPSRNLARGLGRVRTPNTFRCILKSKISYLWYKTNAQNLIHCKKMVKQKDGYIYLGVLSIHQNQHLGVLSIHRISIRRIPIIGLGLRLGIGLGLGIGFGELKFGELKRNHIPYISTHA